MMLVTGFNAQLQAATLDLQLDKSRIEMGKFIIATITYHGSKSPAAIDLSQWQDDFYFDRNDPDTVDDENNQLQQQTRVRLYPRHSGEITLDAIAAGGAIAYPRHVQVLPAIRNGIDATPKLQALKTEYWADEAIDIQIDVALHDKRNNVAAKDFEPEFFDSLRLPDQTIDKDRQPAIRLHWQLLSARKGDYWLELPSIVQRGRGRFRFYLPKLKLHIKPLPAYLPPTVPVGQPKVTVAIKTIANQKILQLSIQNRGRLPDGLQGFSDFLQALGIDESTVVSKDISQQGVIVRIKQIPLPTWLWPRQIDYRLNYFDSTAGQLKTLQQPLPWLWHAPRGFYWLMILLATLLMFLGMNRLDRWAARWRQRYRLRQQLIRANNPPQLRKILIDSAAVNTLQQWAQQFSRQRTQASALASRLDRACFSNQPTQSLAALKQDSVRLV